MSNIVDRLQKYLFPVTFSLFAGHDAFASCPFPYKMKDNESVSEIVYRSMGSPLYGRKGHLRKVARLNPKIKNINRVRVATTICFPFDVELTHTQSSSQITASEELKKSKPQPTPKLPTKQRTNPTTESATDSNVASQETMTSQSGSELNSRLMLGFGLGAYSLSYSAQSSVSDADFSSSKIPSLHTHISYENENWNLTGLINVLPSDLPQSDDSKKTVSETEFGGSVGYNVGQYFISSGQLRLDWIADFTATQQPHLNYSSNQTTAASSIQFLRGLTGVRLIYTLAEEWNLEFKPEIQLLASRIGSSPSHFQSSQMWQLGTQVHWLPSEVWSYGLSYRLRNESLKFDQTLNGSAESISVDRPSHLVLLNVYYQFEFLR